MRVESTIFRPTGLERVVGGFNLPHVTERLEAFAALAQRDLVSAALLVGRPDTIHEAPIADNGD